MYEGVFENDSMPAVEEYKEEKWDWVLYIGSVISMNAYYIFWFLIFWYFDKWIFWYSDHWL